MFNDLITSTLSPVTRMYMCMLKKYLRPSLVEELLTSLLCITISRDMGAADQGLRVLKLKTPARRGQLEEFSPCLQKITPILFYFTIVLPLFSLFFPFPFLGVQQAPPVPNAFQFAAFSFVALCLTQDVVLMGPVISIPIISISNNLLRIRSWLQHLNGAHMVAVQNSTIFNEMNGG